MRFAAALGRAAVTDGDGAGDGEAETAGAGSDDESDGVGLGCAEGDGAGVVVEADCVEFDVGEVGAGPVDSCEVDAVSLQPHRTKNKSHPVHLFTGSPPLETVFLSEGEI